MQFFLMSIPAAVVLFFFTDYVQIISTEASFLRGMLYVSILALVATALL
jgi:ABC-type multidrug transport system permease subunit